MGLLSTVFESAARGYSRIAPTERGGYRIARFVRHFRAREQWRDTFITPAGLLMQLDLGTYPDCCMAFGLYELDTARVIRSILKPGDHFVDAGANIGYFTMMAAQLVGPSGRVDAFEPEPANHARLLAHVQANHLNDRVRLHAMALSDQACDVIIHRYPEDDARFNHGCSTLFADEDAGVSTTSTTVPAKRMDELIHDSVPKLVKLDVEGAESLVIGGMSKILQSSEPPILIGEYNPAQSKVADIAPEQWIRLALAIQPRYQVYRIPVGPNPVSIDSNAFCHLEQVNLMLRVT